MEKVQDFLKELRTRLNNPLFASFIIAWLVINWQVPVALLFYKTAEWKAEQGIGYIDYIKMQVSAKTGILWPLTSALIYILVAPLLKNVIRAFNAYVDRKGTDWTLAATKGSSVPIEKHMLLRAEFHEKLKALAEIYQDDSKYLEQNRVLLETADLLRKEVTERGADLEKLRSRSDVKHYEGSWRLTYVNKEGTKVTDTVSIVSGRIQQTEREALVLLKITRVAYTGVSNELLLTFDDLRNNTQQPFFMVLYQPDPGIPIYINRAAGQIIDRLEKLE